jgi:predicted PurR-regulated permease PerM
VFAGCVLAVGVLYWAQALLVPIALAGLLAFLLVPVVRWLERWIGRVPSVLAVVALTSALAGLAGWGLMRQASSMVEELPVYRENIRRKIADVRWLQRGGAVEEIQRTVDDIKAEMAGPLPPKGSPERPVVVAPEQSDGLWLPAWLGTVLEPLATAGLVIVLVIFMLLEREDVRNRLLGLFGHGTLAVTTKAFDEAAMRVSHYLLMQSIVNLLFGIGAGIGLLVIGVPYAPLWAVLAAALRFIPYVGPWIGGGIPILVSLAALPGWFPVLTVVGLFVVLELFTNLVLETVLYAGAAGISQTALLIAVAFWAWLWGGPGLLLATPLTVCLVVLGKHIPGLGFFATLMADEAVLEPEARLYQRLLAHDDGEAAALVDAHVAAHAPETVYDALLLPALAHAEHDRLAGRLDGEDGHRIVAATRELMRDVALPAASGKSAGRGAGDQARTKILGVAVEPDADELALEMLATLLVDLPFELEIAPIRLLPSEIVTLVGHSGCRMICIADIPPGPDSRTRYLVKKIKAALPEVKIVVGRWGPAGFDDAAAERLVEAGADQVARTLLETRDSLARLMDGAPAQASPSFMAEQPDVSREAS